MPDPGQSQAQREAEAARRRAQFARTKRQGFSLKIKVRAAILGLVGLFFLIGAATGNTALAVPFIIFLFIAGIAWRWVR